MQAGLFDVGDWVLSRQSLSPKQGAAKWHTFYWHGPERPAYWSQDPQEAHVFPSPEAAHDAWASRVEQVGSPLAGWDVRAVVRPPTPTH